MALGFQSTVWRVFGALPGPLVFGAIFDSTCQFWQEECGVQGNCWVYDNSKLSLYLTVMALPCVFVAIVLFVLAFFTYPKRIVDDNDKLENKETELSVPIESCNTER